MLGPAGFQKYFTTFQVAGKPEVEVGGAEGKSAFWGAGGREDLDNFPHRVYNFSGYSLCEYSSNEHINPTIPAAG
jgi:hypothetical protein